MIDTAALKRLDPRPFLEATYGLAFRGTMALCPFHNDKSPSFSVYENGDGWAWKCHSPSCGAAGDVITFVMKHEGVDFKTAAAKFAEWAGARGDTAKPAPAQKATAPAPKPPATPRKPLGPLVESYSYVNAEGREIYRINRHRDPKDFLSEPKGIKREDRILFNLPEVLAAPTVWVVEGEKDVRSVRALGLTATCWSHGVTAWLPHYAEALKGKDVVINLDRGYRAEEERAARDIAKVARSVRIVELPGLTEKDQDITDWIEMHDAQGPEDLRAELERIAAETPLYGAEPDEFPGPEPDPGPDPEPAAAPAAEATQEPAGEARKPFTGTLGQFFSAEIPEAEPLIEGLLCRQEFLYMGGVKHSHKTTAMMDLGLHFAAGKSPWLLFPIPKPGRFLMVQQELGEAEFRKRLVKAVLGGGFDNGVADRFIPVTTTGDPIKLYTDQGVKRLEELIKRFTPDIVGLDPQASFGRGGENDDKTQATLRDAISAVKVKHRCGVILSHHFSSKRPAGSPDAPTELGGWFRGHTVLSDAADAQLGLHRLPGSKDNPNLRLNYEDYNQVEITLRNGKWPPRFAIEFDEGTCLLQLSDVWHEIGARIPLGNVNEVVDAHGGSMLLKDIITYYTAKIKDITAGTIRNAVKREVAAGYLTTKDLPGRGTPILVRSKRENK